MPFSACWNDKRRRRHWQIIPYQTSEVYSKAAVVLHDLVVVTGCYGTSALLVLKRICRTNTPNIYFVRRTRYSLPGAVDISDRILLTDLMIATGLVGITMLQITMLRSPSSTSWYSRRLLSIHVLCLVSL